MTKPINHALQMSTDLVLTAPAVLAQAMTVMATLCIAILPTSDFAASLPTATTSGN